MTTKSKTPMYDELQQIFYFNADDLQKNQNKQLSERQQMVLSLYDLPSRKKLLKNISLSPSQPSSLERDLVKILLLVFGLITAFLVSSAVVLYFTFWNEINILGISGLYLGFGLCIAGMYLLYKWDTQRLIHPRTEKQATEPDFNWVTLTPGLKIDVQRQAIEVVSGKLEIDQKYSRLVFKQALFNLHKRQREQLQTLIKKYPEQVYIFYYLKRSKVILSVEPTSMDKSYWFER